MFQFSTITSASPVRLFNTKNILTDDDHDCFYHYTSFADGRAQQCVPYCIRSPKISAEYNSSCQGTNHTFLSLKNANITVSDLFTFKAPVDLIAEYERYLISGHGADEVWCNCSQTSNRSFGDRCQYTFVFDADSFTDVLEQLFTGKKERDARTLTNDDFTCYSLLNCTTYSGLCLDWRQVCDGMRDCITGHDEENCMEMELSECDPQFEYRCRNGMCIPRSFTFDLTMDCMDFYDEQQYRDTSENCHMDASIDCEEHTCGLSQFSCGDGSCQHQWNVVDSARECKNQRNFLFIKQIYAYTNQSNMTIDCWQHMWCFHKISCLFDLSADNISTCDCSVNTDRYLQCPERYFFPPTHFVFPFVQILYQRQIIDEYYGTIYPGMLAICYNRSVCDIYSNYTSFLVDGYNCISILLFDSYSIEKYVYNVKKAITLALVIQNLFSQCLTNQSETSQTLYACENRLRISHHRRFDLHEDCFPWAKADEVYESTCDRNWSDRYRCRRGTDLRCIPRRLLNDGFGHCFDSVDEAFPSGCTNDFDCQYLREFDISKNLPVIYEELCNGFHRIGLFEDNMENDETNCDQWPCNARATRCNKVWNRPNGCDELNCPQTIPYFISHNVANCSVNEHYCLRLDSGQMTCLPVSKAGDGNIDCLFASDERITNFLNRCRDSPFHYVSTLAMCDEEPNCPLADDERMCPWRPLFSCSKSEFACKNGRCLSEDRRCDGHIDCIDAEDEWLCELEAYKISAGPYKPFDLTHFNRIQNSIIVRHRRSQDLHFYFICHRGVPAYIGNNNEIGCFCPPSYYGKYCEQQSERLTISYKLETLMSSNSQSIYFLVFYLLDEQEQALTVETFTYVSVIHSEKKHYVYLKYPRRNQSFSRYQKLVVRIDTYVVTSNTIDFYLAWFYQVQFPFLPVNRLAVHLLMEERRVNRTICAQLACTHGTCRAFVNNEYHFCHCFTNWTGVRCDQPSIYFNCNPSAKSVVSHGRTLCLCPEGRTGNECQVTFDFCWNVQCQNGGTCLSLDAQTEEHVCICRETFFGNECQYSTAYLILRIPNDISSIPILNIHFLHSPPILPGILLHRSIQFHQNVQPNTELLIHEHKQLYLPTFIFAQLMLDSTSYYGSYYLLALISENRTNLTTSIHAANRCPHVSERLDSTVMNFTWLKRVKFYHQYFHDVKCFHDEIYMCLIDDEQLPDCLQFNHELNNCTVRNYCENDGRCFQHKRSGDLNFACVCPKCTGGSFCQRRMEQFYLTLDSMLGDTILTDTSLQKQPLLIKLLVALITVMFLLGLVSNSLSCLTFFHRRVRQVGCGYYLIVLTFFNQFTLAIFVARFLYLIVGQMTIIRNKQAVTGICTVSDFFLSLHIYVCDWLTACIACERTISVILGAKFDREKSVKIVKFVVLILYILVVLTSLHQPFSRVLINDPRNDERFWCVINFRSIGLKYYTIITNLFHSITPFLVNFFSAIILLIYFARVKQRAIQKEKYITIVVKQVRQHKDLIISPLVMIVFKLPSIIVMLVIKCIESKWQLYLSVTTYFISLLPLLMTFFVFILPASTYRKISTKKWSQFWKRRNV